MSKRNYKKIDVVHDNQLEGLLSNLGILKDITSGKVLCKFCRDVMTLDSLYSVFPESGDIKIVCNKPKCIKQFVNYINQKKI